MKMARVAGMVLNTNRQTNKSISLRVCYFQKCYLFLSEQIRTATRLEISTTISI